MGRSRRRITIASMLAIICLLVVQTVDQALAGVVLPSGAGTLTIGPQAMEGNLQIHPGDTVKAGYDFTMPGAHAPAQVTVDNASITMAVSCSNGATPPAITFALPVQTYNDPAGSPSWYPSGDQANAAVYQASIIAPDLCSGGVMSDAKGATFNATIFTTDTADKVNFRFHYSDNTSGSWSATATAPLTATAKTVFNATLIPSLGLTLAVDHTSAIPGDMLTYSGTVTNTGATLTLTGDFTASASGTSSATVKSYWDDVATSLDSTTWTALAGTAAAATGYTPAVTAPITSGMTLTSTPVAANGVTYPASGDPLVGTTMASGSSALWHYTASVPLTPSQVTTLLDPTKVKAIRNSFHLEVAPTNPNTTQPSVVNVDFSGIFFAASPAPSGTVTNITVTVQPPTGAAIAINSGTVAGLASLGPGGSASYSTTYNVPVPSAKATSETDTAYVQRLASLEGSSLKASASVTAAGPSGSISANALPVFTIEHLPIISITKSGPASRDAGASVSYQLALQNNGGASAGPLTVIDALSDGGAGNVTNVPASLAPTATATASATYTIPAATRPGTLTDTAAVSWKDANSNAYGPSSSSFATQVTTNGVPPEIQPVTSTTVQGNFFAEPAAAQTFVAVNGDTPAFSQNFPTINFNPPAGRVPHNISGVGPQTRPFTDVTTDLVGNFAGPIPAQGGIFQAGVGPLQSFDAALQASFIVQAAGDVTFVIYHDDGFVFGIGNGATRVSGVYVAPPAATAFANYPVIGAFNQMVAAPRTDEVTVHFPAGGTYAYELDYFEAGADSLTLTLTTAPAPSGSTGSTAGGVFVTGHDPDFHAVQGPNPAGAQHIIQRAIATVTRAKAQPKVLLVMDTQDPGSGSSDPRSGMIAAGFTTFDVADYGSGAAGVLDLRTVAFANYDVIVVASDFGGWLRQAELNVLDGRAGDIATYLGQGGGLVAFAESGASNLTVTGRFGFLPCLNAISGGGGESGFQLTSLGQAIGLVPTDVNSNFYHNVFASPCGMDVVDFDTAGRPVSLTSTGVSRSWNIAHDFQLAPNQANPSNGGVWSYLQSGTNPLAPSGYSKLSNFTSQAYSIAGLQQWTGSFASGGRSDDLLPAAGVNASGASQHPLTFVWPNGVFRVHPWTAAVVVGWTSPFTGTVHVEGAVTHLDQACGDGVRWNVLSGSTGLASGQVTFGANAGQFLSEGSGGASLNQINVTTGQSLYFIVDAGAQGDFLCDSTALDVTVVEGAAPVTRPLPPATTLLIQPASVGATVGQGVNLTVSAMDGLGAPVPGVPVAVSVSGPNSLSLQVSTDATGVARISYVSAAAGTDLVNATANLGGRLSVSNTATVTWTVPGPDPNLAPPTISAPSPADGTIVTKPVPITATIAPPAGQTIASWSVSYTALGLAPVTIASGTGAPPALLATFDPTLVPDGIYAITVRGTASGGGSQSITASVVVSGTLKPGRFVSTFRDLSVPVNGQQMESRRTYDSTDKSIGDFGTGWKLSFSNLRISTNRQLGAGGWTEYPSHCIFGLCFYSFKTSTPHYVSVTFPDQHQETFDFTPQGGGGILYWQGSAAFTARGGMGTTSTLQVAGDTGLSYGFDGNLYDGSGSFYSPTRFQLTTREGRVFVLDTTSGLVSETDPNGNSLNLDSSGVHFLLGPVSNPTAGPSITISRDPSNSNRITEVAGPNDGVNGQNQHVLYNYNAAGQLASVTDPEGHTVHYTYDSSTGLLTGSKDPGGQPIQTITYGPDGRVTSIANGSEPATTIATAAGAQQQTTLDPNGQLTTVVTYDALGDILEKDQSFAAQTLSTKMAYDGAGRMTDLYDPTGHHQHWTFDETDTNAAGELLSYTDASGHTWQFTNYDARGQVGTVLAPDGSTSGTYTYNASGLMISSQIPGESPTLYTYDRSGTTKSVTDPKGRSVSYAYNSVGFMTSEADSAGNAVSYTPDAAGNIVAVKDASGNTTTFAYNGSSQLTGETDGAGVAYSYSYDGRGHLASASDPAGTTSYLYNDLGLVRQRTDSNGAVTAYTYDAEGNLTLETRPGGDTTTYRYDPLKQLVAAENGSGELNLTYDRSGNLASQTSCAPQAQGAACPANTSTASEPTATLTYQYFPNGDEQSVSGPSGLTTYGYDGADRLSSVIDTAGHPVVYANTPRGFPSSITFPDGVLQSRGYDGSGLVASNIATLSGATVAGDTYGLDPVSGRVNSVSNQDGTANFGHQVNGWLSSEAQPAAAGLPSQTFSYDGAGNLTSWGAAPPNTVKYDSAGRLIQAGTVTFGYDGEGDLLSKTNSTNTTPTAYTWNADHQLIAISYPDSTKSQYQYDPLGRRITANTKGQITRYVYDGFNVTAAYDGQNNQTIAYTLTPTGGRFADPQSPATVLEALQGSAAAYYMVDGNGSTIATLDSNGSVTARYRYSAFGQPAGANGPENTYTYQGAQYDSTSGLYYMTDRYYDPGNGRFLSRDPVASQYLVPALGNRTRHTGLSAPSLPSSLQRYPFGSNDPLDFSDPSGDIPIPLVGAKIAAATCALFIAFSPATPAADAPIVQDCQQLISAAADLVTKRGALSQYYSQLAKNPNFARLLMAEEEAQADDDFLTGAMGLQDEVIALEG